MEVPDFRKKVVFLPCEELNEIDSNCNNCKNMVRDMEKFKSFDYLHEKKARRINYGNCLKLNKAVSFIPGDCMIENIECWEKR